MRIIAMASLIAMVSCQFLPQKNSVQDFNEWFSSDFVGFQVRQGNLHWSLQGVVKTENLQSLEYYEVHGKDRKLIIKSESAPPAGKLVLVGPALQPSQLSWLADKGATKLMVEIKLQSKSGEKRKALIETEFSAEAKENVRTVLGLQVGQAQEFDGRTWKLGHSDRSGNRAVVEYILEGESINNWSELFTASTMYGNFSEHNLKLLYLDVKHKIASDCPAVQWELLTDSKGDIIYRWSHKGCGEWPAQIELARMFYKDSGIFIYRYTIKGTELEEKRANQWLQILKDQK